MHGSFVGGGDLIVPRIGSQATGLRVGANIKWEITDCNILKYFGFSVKLFLLLCWVKFDQIDKIKYQQLKISPSS